LDQTAPAAETWARGEQRPMGTRHMDMTQGQNKKKKKGH